MHSMLFKQLGEFACDSSVLWAAAEGEDIEAHSQKGGCSTRTVDLVGCLSHTASMATVPHLV